MPSPGPDKVYSLCYVNSNLLSLALTDTTYEVPAIGIYGEMLGRPLMHGPGLGGASGNIGMLANGTSADGVAVTTIGVDPNLPLATLGYPYGFNGATFDRLRTVPDNADNQNPLGIGTLAVVNRLQAYNPGTSKYDRVIVDGNNADNIAPLATGLVSTAAHTEWFNGTSWDRGRNNSNFQILPSAVRNATTVSADITNYDNTQFFALINVTAAPGIETLTFSLEGKDPVTGLYTQILTGLGTTLVGPYGIGIGAAVAWSGWTAVGSAAAVTFMPRILRVRVTHSGAGNWTYSVAGFQRK